MTKKFRNLFLLKSKIRFLQFVSVVMAKSKNHTNHNQNRKAHRNGIPRPKKSVYKQMSLKGVDPKVLFKYFSFFWKTTFSSSATCVSLRRATSVFPRNKPTKIINPDLSVSYPCAMSVSSLWIEYNTTDQMKYRWAKISFYFAGSLKSFKMGYSIVWK